jgi:hypothetical protein
MWNENCHGKWWWWIMSWKGCKQKMSWLNFRYYPGVLVGGLRKSKTNLSPAEVRIRLFPNTSHSRYRFLQLPQYWITVYHSTKACLTERIINSATKRMSRLQGATPFHSLMGDLRVAFSSLRPGEYLTSYHTHPSSIITLLFYVPNYITVASDGISCDRTKCKNK